MQSRYLVKHALLVFPSAGKNFRVAFQVFIKQFFQRPLITDGPVLCCRSLSSCDSSVIVLCDAPRLLNGQLAKVADATAGWSALLSSIEKKSLQSFRANCDPQASNFGVVVVGPDKMPRADIVSAAEVL